MISPPLTASPANVFTPSRCALESRPLRLEPSPFLCAIVPLGLGFRGLGGPRRVALGGCGGPFGWCGGPFGGCCPFPARGSLGGGGRPLGPRRLGRAFGLARRRSRARCRVLARGR